jgi:hypothetical protein
VLTGCADPEIRLPIAVVRLSHAALSSSIMRTR